MTFARACQHIKNYSAAHESRAHLPGPERLAYPPDHIEVDNRLSWFLGALDKKFGDDAFYVHLIRDREAVARSHLKRIDHGGIMKAFDQVILAPQSLEEYRLERTNSLTGREKMERCLDYCDTVNSNIALFLKDKSQKMQVRLENVKRDFEAVWMGIEAKGDLQAALAEWDVKHNASSTGNTDKPEVFLGHSKGKAFSRRVFSKGKRLLRKFPQFLRDA